MTVSIIIPTFNEESSISQTLDALAKIPEPVEVIVVDGGSHDETVRLVSEHGVRFIRSGRGRGTQMHAGAVAARGEVFWFLHADSLPSADAVERIVESLAEPQVVGGTFNVHFDGRQLSVRFLTCFYRQLRALGVCYGDSAIFVRRETYERIGGFKQFSIFEDLDLVRRVRKEGRMAQLTACVVASSRRFEHRSFLLTFVKWVFLQMLYWAGVNPQTLGKHYAPVRNASAKTASDILPRRHLSGVDTVVENRDDLANNHR